MLRGETREQLCAGTTAFPLDVVTQPVRLGWCICLPAKAAVPALLLLLVTVLLFYRRLEALLKWHLLQASLPQNVAQPFPVLLFRIWEVKPQI